MNYTIEDLRGKYVEVGTPECKVFLDACEKLGLRLSFDLIRGLVIHVSEQGRIYQDRAEFVEEKGLTPFTPKPIWSIYNNDKPLSELSDEQAAELFIHWRKGGKLINNLGHGCDHPSWSLGVAYRAKQKSEKELFIEAAKSIRPSYIALNPVCLTLLDEMFNAGFKAPNGGE